MNRFKRNYNLNKSFDNYNKNPNQKYESEQNLMNPPISNIDLENSLNSCLLINQYINLNNEALNLLSKEQASKALSCYQKASSIANQLRDKFKIKESECNKGIAYYHLNDIKKAIELLQSCYNYFYKICCEENNNIDIKNLTLLCKAGANLCMCKITLLNDKDDCINLIKDIINIISQEDNINNQIFCLKYLNNILFNVNSLIPINENIISNYLDANEEEYEDDDKIREDEIDRTNHLFYETFFNFIATNEIDTWINSLDKIYQKMEKLNYKSGMIKILLNQLLSKCIKYSENNEENNNLNNEQEYNDAQLKLLCLIKTINQSNNKNVEFDNDFNNNEEDDNINNDQINNMINEYRYKLSIIQEIYEILSSFENKINNNQNKYQNNQMFNKNYYINNIQNNNKYSKKYNSENINQNQNNEYFLKLSLKYTMNYFAKNIEDQSIKNDLINNIQKALDSINNPQNSGLDFSNINITSLDSDLYDNLSNIFTNLDNIILKDKSRDFFYRLNSYKKKDIYKPKISNKLKSVNPIISNKIENNIQKKQIIQKNIPNEKKNDFLEKAYIYIYNGEMINKINFKTMATKEHYFQIEYKTDKLQYFIDRNAKIPKKEFDFDEIFKVKVGIYTLNVKKKINILGIASKNKNYPYRFLSFIFDNNRSGPTLDLVFKKSENAKMWFYGLYRYFEISKRPYKICSCTNYILYRIKCKAFKKLNLDMNDNKKTKFSFAKIIRKYSNKYNIYS